MFLRASNWGGVNRNKCLNETEPIYKVGYKAADYSMMEKAISYFGTLEQKGICVDVLNITELSDYRKDGHPTVFRKQFTPLTKEEMATQAATRIARTGASRVFLMSGTSSCTVQMTNYASKSTYYYI